MTKTYSLNKHVKTALAIVFWLVVWQAASMLLNRTILLASPVEAAVSLFSLVQTSSFWLAVGNTFFKIVLGFMLALLTGTLFAALSAASRFVKTLLSPLASVIKATPVVSFIILALLWIDSVWLSTFISFLMVFPVIYIATLSGIESAHPKLIEAARVFRMKAVDRIKYIYLPAASKQHLASVSVALGLCWKSGVAAEVIGLPSGTIGERLYQAKLYLDTGELFAFTAVIILISALFERVFSHLLKRAFSGVSKEAENADNT